MRHSGNDDAPVKEEEAAPAVADAPKLTLEQRVAALEAELKRMAVLVGEPPPPPG